MTNPTLLGWMHAFVALTLVAPSSGLKAAGPLRADDAVAAEKRAWDFEHSAPGKVPKGWSIRQTNPTKAMATWRVAVDGTAPSQPTVFALTATDNHHPTFNLAVADDTLFKDLDLRVRVKAITGVEDQGGGPIWRCRDANNYYVCRFNPLEGNYRLYKVVDGRRQQLESAKVETEPGKWYAVRVTMAGGHIICYLGGKKLLETTDVTFKEPGKIGLWTKADAVTSFDDLSVRGIKPAKDGARPKH